MEEIKVSESVTLYKASEGDIFIHKEKGIELFGEVVVVDFTSSEHRIEDFEIITQKEFEKIKNKKEN